jgi:2',3'-cyclic-nucleotide 2'-phosphodiesterase / 3'-nucleotidase / 5'-nucleotidase
MRKGVYCVPMLSLLLAFSVATAPLQDSAHVVLVATTDVHGHATAWDYLKNQPFPGGIARVAVVIDSLRRRYPGQVVTLDAGDLLQGDPFATYYARVAPRDPHPIIEAMNLAGYDVVTPGNHDFDWGVPAFRRAQAEAAFPYVSANIFALPGDTLLFAPFRVLRRGGIRVGVTGFTTPGVMLWDQQQLKGQIRVGRIETAAKGALDALRRSADLSVVVIHSGLDGASSYDTTGVGGENVADGLADLSPKPDVVIVGHSHREIRDTVIGGVHFVQPRPFGGSVSVVHVSLSREDGGRWRVVRVHADLVNTRDLAPSPLVTQRLAPEHEAVREWVSQPLATVTAPMPATAARAEPTPIADLVLDLERRHTRADLASAPVFDLRTGFRADTIRRADVLALYPYANILRAIRISGAQLKAYLEWSSRYFQLDPVGRVSLNDSVIGYNYDVVAGARYDIDLRRPVGERIRNLAVRGRMVQPADSFTMAINSYRHSGTGRYDMLRGAPVVYDKGELIHELLEQDIRARGRIDPGTIPRSEWRIVPDAAAAGVRNLFGVAPSPEEPGPQDTVVLRVMSTADLHGDLLPGAAALADRMDSLTTACNCPTLRFDVGDAMQGTVLSDATEGRAAVEVLNHLGYAAAALGEHDFDWSVDTLRRRMSESRYPRLAANVFDSASGRRPDWAIPYRVLDAGGMKVAVIGYVTVDAKSMFPPDRTRGLRFGEGELALHDVLGEVRSLQPGLTVLLAHAGATCDSIVCTGEVIRLAEQLGRQGVDLILAGHTHRILDTRVAGIAVVESSGPSSLAVVDVVKTPAGGKELRTRVDRVDPEMGRGTPALAAALDVYARRADTLDRRPLAQLKRPLLRSGTQFPLGGLLAEARRNLFRADVGLIPTSAIRADLPAGPVTYARLAQVEPWRRNLVRVTLTGTELRALLEKTLEAPQGPTAHVAGVLVRYDPKAAVGRRVRNVVLQGNRKLRDQDAYTLATDDSTAADAVGFEMLQGRPTLRSGILDVEAAAAFLRRLPQPVEVSAAGGFFATRRRAE